MIEPGEASVQGDVLLAAAAQSPLPTVAGLLRAMGNEWRDAGSTAHECAQHGYRPWIVPSALLQIGNEVWVRHGGAARVLRVANGGLGVQVLVTSDDGYQQAQWINPLTTGSPIVMAIGLPAQLDEVNPPEPDAFDSEPPEPGDDTEDRGQS